MQLSPILSRVPAASSTTCIAIAKSCRDKLTRRVLFVFCITACSHKVMCVAIMSRVTP